MRWMFTSARRIRLGSLNPTEMDGLGSVKPPRLGRRHARSLDRQRPIRVIASHVEGLEVAPSVVVAEIKRDLCATTTMSQAAG